MIRHIAAGSIIAVALAGCTAGTPPPRLDAPLSPPVAAERVAPAAGPSQRIVVGARVPQRWWTAFGSTKLDALVTTALARNQDIETADAALRQAREQLGATRGASLPQVDAGYQAERARVSNALSSPLADVDDTLYTLHTAQLTIAYPLDLFGSQRNRIRSARAAAEVARQRLAAARLTVAGNLVQAVILQAALAEEIDAAQASIRSNRDIAALLRRRQALGDIGEADVAAQATALATAEAVLPPLQRQRAHARATIAALTGTAPGAAMLDLPGLGDLRLPADLPVSLPADIVAARPDMRAAEAQVRGAAADVGTAVAARLPQFQLSGNAGGSAERFASLLAPANLFFALIGGVTQPLFHGGTLRHQQHAAEAALAGAEAQYRAAAIQAFVELDDALAGLRTDAATADAATRADAAAALSLGFVRRQAQLGSVGTLALLGAGSAAAQASLARVQAQAARLTDTVALFQAEGGGGDAPPAPPAPPTP